MTATVRYGRTGPALAADPEAAMVAAFTYDVPAAEPVRVPELTWAELTRPGWTPYGRSRSLFGDRAVDDHVARAIDSVMGSARGLEPEARHDVRQDAKMATVKRVRERFPIRSPEEWAVCADIDWTPTGGGYTATCLSPERLAAYAAGVVKNKVADALRADLDGLGS